MARILLAVVGLVFALASEAVAATVHRLPPVSISGAPRSLVTFSVALPQDLEDATDVAFSVELRGTADVLGRLDGNLGGGGRRQLLLTVRVPSDARVGLLDIADVHFRTEDGREFVVPIILRVPAVRVIRLLAPPMFMDLRQGDRLELTYRVQNLGNAPERVRVEVEAPGGWVMRSPREATVSVEAFETKDVTFRVAIPVIAEGGEYLVPANAMRVAAPDSAPLATVMARLQLVEREITAPGLELRPFVAAAASRQASGLATGLSLRGPIADSTMLNLTLMPIATRSGAAGLGLAGIGVAAIPVQASITSPAWTTVLGSTAVNIGDLTGLNVIGAGGQTSYRRGTREAHILVARPFGAEQLEGEQLSAGMAWQTGIGRVGGAVSMLSERGEIGLTRELRALGMDWESRPMRDWVVDAGVALRDAGDIQGVGSRFELTRDRREDYLRLRVVHAPGGIRAFANGSQNIEGEARRDFGERLTVSANFQSTADASNVFGSFRNRTATVTQQYRWRDGVSLRAQVQYLAFATSPAGGVAGSFGSSQTVVGAGAAFPLGAWSLSTDARGGVLTREAELFSGAVDRQQVLQREFEVGATRGISDLAQLSLGTTLTQTGAGLGVPATAATGFASLGGMRLPLGRERELVLFSRVGYVGSSVQSPVLISAISGTTRLPGNFELTASVERNPFFRDRQGRAQLIAALRISTAATVFVPQRLQRVSGVVFEDLNLNGKRDAGERGVPGVVLRQAGVRIVTDADGAYRVPANQRGRIQVDPLGLPRGFVPSPRLTRDLAELRDIPLVQTGTLRVRLQLAADADGRVPDVKLETAEVWLVDSDGMEWVGRVAADGEVFFENVPAGRYSFRFDFTRLSEPLRAEESATAEVRARETIEITLPLRGRNVRVTPPPNRQDGGRGNGRGSVGGNGRVGSRDGRDRAASTGTGTTGAM